MNSSKHQILNKSEDTVELPQGWIWTTIGEIGIIQSGGTPSTRNKEFWGGEIAWITPADLSGYNDKFISRGKRNITQVGLDYSSAKLLPAGSICFSSRAPIGYTVITKNELATNQGFKNLIPTKSLNSEYVYYYFKTLKSKAEKVASGTTFLELSASKFSQLPFPLPPLKEQARIVSKIETIFTELDQSEKGLRKAKQQLELYRQVILKKSVTNSDVKESKLGDYISKIGINIKPDKKSKYNFISLSSINPNSLKLHQIYEYNNFSSSGIRFSKGDILYSRMRPNLNKVYKAEFEGVCSGEFFVLKCSDSLNTDFLKYLLHSDDFVEYATNKAKGDRPRLSYDDFSLYKTSLIPISEQEKIVQDIDSKFSLIDNLESTINKSIQVIELTRNSILKQAFEGRLVLQDPTYEPASRLLKQIKIEKEKYLTKQVEFKKNRPKKIIKMRKSLSIEEVLKSSDKPILAKIVWQESKHNEDIVEFYAQLKELGEKVVETRKGLNSLLSLKK
ncbi:restriction endonuclease subunit S [Brumimicrobium glaciale]|uniref:restriction endonuclease subunit S n=1 Tax=Brumimicrobium glaciale TaxID=200475 RepID=UPI0013EB0C4E|nr:restriction endonuclease subunit S [Brumimicrobium glaciale]